MNMQIYQVDAFTDRIFGGNPAAVCPLESWLSDDILQNIAMENNLSETGFYVKKGDDYEIRWFTPTVEVELCGHATLAAAHVIFTFDNYPGEEITFHSKSGILKVGKRDQLLTMNFPADNINRTVIPPEAKECFGIDPVEAYKGRTDFILVFQSQKDIEEIDPNFHLINKLDARGVIVTAPGNEVDFVSRFFCPQVGINEDPVTGSAHTTLTPYWSERLNKTRLTALQLSARKGYLLCEFDNDRVKISGKAKTYMKGKISIQ